ncbi:MAG: TMEM165/GDT1 family protein [Infirmifilum sp.]
MVWERLFTFAETALLVLLAELGDKTMLATATLAMFNNPFYVLGVSLLGFLIANAVPVAAACMLSSLLQDQKWIMDLLAGLLFTLLGIHMWRKSPSRGEGKTLGTTFAALVLSEIGDKTQITTVAVAARIQDPLLTVLGGLAGYLAANVVGIFALRLVANTLQVENLGRAASLVFILVGIATLLDVFL